jgi:hypothetical protein
MRIWSLFVLLAVSTGFVYLLEQTGHTTLASVLVLSLGAIGVLRMWRREGRV